MSNYNLDSKLTKTIKKFCVRGEEGKENRDRSVRRAGGGAFPLVVAPPLATLPPSLIPQIMIMSGENSRINQPNIECLPARPVA